jgi:hypothetical protein
MSSHERTSAEAAPDAKRSRTDTADPLPCISVLMPCRNAMPWLPDAVASVLAQMGLEHCGGIELIAVDDSSTDGSREWLTQCAAALAAADAKAADEEQEQEEKEGGAGDATTNIGGTETKTAAAAAAAAAAATAEGAVCGFPADRLEWETSRFTPRTVAQVVSNRRRNNTLVVLTVDAFGPSGQGKALNLAYARARGRLIGEMESDDLRPPHAFVTLHAALSANPTWDCATSEVRLIGWNRPGMERWIAWQNAQNTPRAMAKGRFLEIPALRGSGLYRRAALAVAAAADGTGAGAGVDAAAAASAGVGAVAAAASAPAAGASASAAGAEAAASLAAASGASAVATAALASAAAGASSALASSAIAPYRDLWMINGQVADCANATDPLYARPERAPLRPSGWWPVDADFWQRWFTAVGLYNLNSVEP